MPKVKLEGIFVPNVTPFDRQGGIDADALGRLVDFWLGRGVSGLVVNASTGEGPLLSRQEQGKLLELMLDRAGGKVKVIAGTGAVGTRGTIELTMDARDRGAEAALVVTPYFFKPSDEELFHHYSHLLASVDMPVVLYNVPKFTGYSIAPRVIERIAREHDNLAGVKDSSSDPGLMAEIIRLVGDRVSVLSGSGDMILPNLALGGKGAIVAIANVIPGTCVDIYDAFVSGDLRESGGLQMKASYVNKVLIRDHSQIAALKYALSLRGLDAGIPRRPLMPLPQKEERDVSEALKSIDLF
jgi:4-hydroxy-tetrahydrodipicolinate synthase